MNLMNKMSWKNEYELNWIEIGVKIKLAICRGIVKQFCSDHNLKTQNNKNTILCCNWSKLQSLIKCVVWGLGRTGGLEWGDWG